MSNILITSIGGKTYDKEKNELTYKPARYVNTDGQVVESAYVLDALWEFYPIDKCIIVGTAGSQWAAFYEHLSKSGRLSKMNEDYWLELLELGEQQEKHRLPPEDVRRELEPLRQAMGGFCCEIVVLKYGLDDAEILRNFALLSNLGRHIQDGDNIYFDITHSFRSLALYEYMAVSYLQNVLQKNIRLEFVSYGMYDFARENGGLSPIVDLSQLLRLTDWIKAAEEYNRFGTARLLAELLKKNRLGLELSDDSRKALDRLGNPMITSNLEEFRNLIKNCEHAIKRLDEARGQTQIVGYVLRDLALRFGGEALQNDPLMIALLAQWHHEKKRYIEAAITLQEFVMNYCARLANLRRADFSEWQDIQFQRQVHDRMYNWKKRDLLRGCSNDVKSVIGNFTKQYLAFAKLRNQLCHGKHLDDNQLKQFEGFITWFVNSYSPQFYQRPENEAALRTLLENIQV